MPMPKDEFSSVTNLPPDLEKELASTFPKFGNKKQDNPFAKFKVQYKKFVIGEEGMDQLEDIMNKSLKGEYRIIDERQYFAVKSGEVIVVVKYLVPKEEGDKKEDGTEQILGERRKRKALAAVAATTQDKK